jgi:hypothetical protein
MNRLLQLIDRSLNGRVTPLAYLVTIHTFIFGASFVLLSGTASVRASLLYREGALIGVYTWGSICALSALACLYGMKFKVAKLAEVGAFGVFLSWLFASITYGSAELWLQMALAVTTCLYFGYIFLASALDRLWDYTPQ